MAMEKISGGVTSARGFKASAAAAGIKYEKRDDMAMIFSETPCVCAGTFTTNVVKAAPVVWDRAIVEDRNPVNAVVINSGIANACTGDEGIRCCERTAGAAAEVLGVSPRGVLVASTGVIGMEIPVSKIEVGVRVLARRLNDSEKAATSAARAIMTTDTRQKQCAVRISIGGTDVTIGGMCKGSGMIHPNMCTMLSFLTTDAAISGEMLQKALSESVDKTYNMISVDGDTSTNDTVLILANGQAKNRPITADGPDFAAFCDALNVANTSLAKQIAGDGEGASSLLEVKVTGARDEKKAGVIARSVVSSSLVKAAVYGRDANWGRVLCAMGYCGEEFDPEKTDIFFESKKGSVKVAENGAAAVYSEARATDILSSDEVTIVCDIKEGDACARAWGCDLTYDYVRINADYRS